MKRFLLPLVFLSLLGGNALSQQFVNHPVRGNLGEYPYLYYYNFPQTGVMMEDSVVCNIEIFGATGGVDLNVPIAIYDYILHMHTDEVLHIEGIAIGNSYPGTLTLFDSNRTPLKTVNRGWFQPYNDTCNYFRLIIPGNVNGLNGYWSGYWADILQVCPFSRDKDHDTIIDITGDFYLRYSCGIPGDGALTFFFKETHPAPYHFFGSEFFLATSEGWGQMDTNRAIPLLFPVIRPDCVSVDSVSAVSDSAGCISVDWELLPIHSRWMVRLTDDSGNNSVTVVDTNHLQLCGLQPGTTYTVSVQSRCRDYRWEHLFWSPWSDSLTVTVSAPDTTSPDPGIDTSGVDPGIDTTGTDPGIDTTGIDPGGDTTGISCHGLQGAGLTLSPNPAGGTVRLTCTEPMLRAEVIDVAGRTVAVAEPHGKEALLDVGHLPAGVYSVRVTTPSGILLRRLGID